ncbi:MAG: CBS domain-containing protein, partial [Bacteroidota bacterium]
EHTRLMTISVKEIINAKNPLVKSDDTLFDALSMMTESGQGAVAIVDGANALKGIFTDGDLRRNLKEKGKDVLDMKMENFVSDKAPITVPSDARLYEAVKVFKDANVDNIIVLENMAPIGMLDIQDFVRMNLIG